MKKARSILAIALVLCYAAGLVSMLFFSFRLGVLLWVLSTVGGGLLLYNIRRQEELIRQAEEARKRAEEEAKAQ